MKKAVERIEQAVKKHEKVAVYGDYDVDGTCATFIMWDFLYRHLKLDVIPFIPSRFDEGYGLNEQAIEELGNKGVKLIITVDCGIRDQGLISKFKDLDFIITDHHTLPEGEDFKTIAVHPKRKGSKYPFKEISGTAVAWKLIAALDDGNTYLNYLEFVALATVCDVMPLIDENRAIVKLGLDAMSKTENIGLRTLIKTAGAEGQKLTAYHCGFVLGPRINAAGRLAEAIEVVRLFATESSQKAEQIASELDELNRQRQELTMKTVELAVEKAKSQSSEKLIFVFEPGWHEGIIGLVAGRLAEGYNRPAVAATIIEGKVLASARSGSGYHITNAIAVHSKYLTRYGGHAQAAGFSLEEKNLILFRDALQKLANENISEEDMSAVIDIDSELEDKDLTLENAEWLEKFEPFGLGNSRPVFLVEDCTIIDKKLIGREKQHVKLILSTGTQNIYSKKFEAIHFNASNSYEKIQPGDRIDIVFSLEINSWNNHRKVQLKIKDIKRNENEK